LKRTKTDKPALAANPGRKEVATVKNITRPGDQNKYYMYKGHFIVRIGHNGYYVTYTDNGRIMADTQKGIKELINKGGNNNERI